MKISKCDIGIKCELLACANVSNYKIFKEGEEASAFYVCSECAKGLNKALNNLIAPQSPEAPFKKVKKLR